MKKITLIFLLPCCLAACGQKSQSGKSGNKQNKPEIFNSKYVKLIEDTSKMMLIENVVISYGDLYVEADSALLEKPKEMVTVFGIRKVEFKGKIIDKKEYGTSIRYKKGEARFQTD